MRDRNDPFDNLPPRLSQYYNLCWPSGKGIERSLTTELVEAQIMAQVMSRSSDHQQAQTIMIVDDKANPVMFVHNGKVFKNADTN